MDLELEVQYGTRADSAPARPELERWARAALAGRRQSAQLAVRIVGSEESAGLNRTYRGKAGPTNVLSFPYEPLPGVETALLGDLVICAPVVEAEAREQGKTPRAHWAHMLVHGILHLLGYDHQEQDQALEMERLETEILKLIGFEDPYREVDTT